MVFSYSLSRYGRAASFCTMSAGRPCSSSLQGLTIDSVSDSAWPDPARCSSRRQGSAQPGHHTCMPAPPRAARAPSSAAPAACRAPAQRAPAPAPARPPGPPGRPSAHARLLAQQARTCFWRSRRPSPSRCPAACAIAKMSRRGPGRPVPAGAGGAAASWLQPAVSCCQLAPSTHLDVACGQLEGPLSLPARQR